MPWEETGPMKERVKFILEVEEGIFRFSESCQRYGVSRKTGYKWLRRWKEEGLEGLQDRSRRPHGCPHKTTPWMEDLIVELRQKHEDWGPVTLHERLQRKDPSLRWPAPSTIGQILLRREVYRPRKRRHRGQPVFARGSLQSKTPNEVFTADFKGQFRTGNGGYCYPLTIQDHCARYSLCCQGLESTRQAGVRKQFERVFREYGLPDMILTDNGVPFASHGLRRLSQLSVWWIRLGILPCLIQPGHPEQNGRHERFHRTLKQATALPPQANLEAQQKAFDQFRQEYNHDRPHQSLGGKTPAEVYRPSSRPYPEKLPGLEYPGHFQVRRVSSSGFIKLHAKRVFLSLALGGQQVGFEEIDDELWSIYLADVLLGHWNETLNQIHG